MTPPADPGRDRAYAVLTIALVLLALLVVLAGAPAGEDTASLPSAKHPGALLRSLPSPTPASSEYSTHPELDELATTFAMRPYTIHCPTAEAWAEDPYADLAWGYTTLVWDFAVLDPMLCDAALDVAGGTHGSPAWARALAVLVLTHESYHGRLWHGRADEALVECKAVRHWTVAMRMLGAGEDEISALQGWELAMHWRLVRKVDEYYDDGCEVPNPW